MKNVDRFLRLALAFPLLYASISALLSPKDWMWYIPDWVSNLLPPEPLLLGHGFFELTLGLWLISGKKTYYAAIVAAADLAGTTLLNVGTFTVVFRDVGLIAAAIALAIFHKEIETAAPLKEVDKKPHLPN